MMGIIDDNFLNWGKRQGLPSPNLDAMKWYVYLRKTYPEEDVRLVTSLNSIANYSKVYFLTDKPPEGLPKEIFLQANVEIYGPFFAPSPKLVEHTIPSISLYRDFIEEKVAEERLSSKRALQFLDSIYYKIWGLGGEKLPLPPCETRKRFYLYDKDVLGRGEDSWAALLALTARKPTSLYFVSPIQCHSIKQFIRLRVDFDGIISRSNAIILDYFVPLHQLDYYFDKYRLLLLGEITPNADVNIYLGKNYSNDTYCANFYIRNFTYCANLMFSYWAHNIPIKGTIYQDENSVGEANPCAMLYDALRRWAAAPSKEATLWDQLTKKNKLDCEALAEKHPALRRFLKVTKNDLLNSGEWNVYE